MFNVQTLNEVGRQSRRVKQEAIDNSWSLLNDIPSTNFSYPTIPYNPLEAITVPPLPIADPAPPADTPQPIKKEQDPQEQQLLTNRWEFCKTLLSRIWDAIPAVPSAKSRNEWAKARGVPQANVHSWFNARKHYAKRKGIKVHPSEGYELQVEQPGELLPTSSGGEPGQGIWNTPLASSSLPPSSPLRTPAPFDPLTDFGAYEPLFAAWSPILPSIAPWPPSKVQTAPLFPTSSFEVPVGYKEAPPRETTEKALIAPAPKAKRGRPPKRKAVVDGGEVPAQESAKITTESTPKSKRPKVETKPTVNTPSAATTSERKMPKDTGERSSSLDPKAPTSHTVPPHSFAAETYTSILVAPFILENALKTSSNPPNASSSSSFAPVKEPLIAEPSPYITQPLPPLPAFEALDDPVAFFKDCKDALRASLEINLGSGLWDPVVEALPPSYFLELGKDFDDFEWPEIDWP